MRRLALAALTGAAALAAWSAWASATPPGINGDIAFESFRTGGGDIYAMTAAGANETHIGPPDATEETDPAWSPDGTRIAFSSSESGEPEIYVMNRDGSGRVRITVSAGADLDPAWSPDGARLVWASDRTGNRELFTARLDGSGLIQLTSHVAADGDPEWSQGGTAIVFRSNRTGNGDIYRLSPTGTEVGVQQLTSNAGTDDHPTWAPDSSRIAFDSARGGNTDIYSVVSSGTENGLQRHTNNAQVDQQPSWSPDGKRIVFSSSRSGNFDIWTVGATGTESGPLQLTNDATNDLEPAWQTVAPAPKPTTLSPPSAFAGSGDLAVIVDGSGFVFRSQVRWNGAPRSTQYVSPSRLTFVVPAADLAAPGTATVDVTTSPLGGGTSAPLTFTVSPPTATPLEITRATLTPRWAASRFVGRLRLSGKVGRPALLEARLLRPSGKGKAFATRRFRVKAAGAFTRRLKLVEKLLPGRYLVRVREVGGGSAPLPTAQRTARLAAPREGVAARAFVSTKIGGRSLARIAGRPSIIFAHFALAARPKPGKRLTVSWFQPGVGRPVAVDRKPISALVIAFVDSNSPLPTGNWRAELRYGGKLVAVARTRLV